MDEWFGFSFGEHSLQFGLVLVLREDLWGSLVLVFNPTLIGYGLSLVQLRDHCQVYGPKSKRYFMFELVLCI